MKVSIDFQGKNELAKVTFFLQEFNTDRDIFKAIMIVQIFAADFDLDPELEVGDFEGILARVRELNKIEFTIMISEDDIEVDLG